MPTRTLADAHKELHAAFNKARADFENAYPHVEVGISAVYRSPEEQFKLFKIGRKEERDGVWVLDPRSRVKPVTYLDGKHKLSKHNYYPSWAVDFFIQLHGKITWEIEWYRLLGELCKHYGLLWGGDFKMVDGPHAELPGRPNEPKPGRT